MTGSEFIAQCKADLCSTQSRSKNGKNYYNKYTIYFGEHGYAGINKKGVFTKRYKYGVVGHCCIGVQYQLVKAGLGCFVPKSTKGHYYWNTNVYRAWLKAHAKKGTNFNGWGKITHVSIANCKPGALVFKPGHICVFISYDSKTGIVTTVDFNVSDGKGNNNGTVQKRKKSAFNDCFNLPYPGGTPTPTPKPTPKPKTTTVKYKVNTSKSNLIVRKSAKKSSKKVGSLKKGTIVKSDKKSGKWTHITSPKKGWVSSTYLKKV